MKHLLLVVVLGLTILAGCAGEDPNVLASAMLLRNDIEGAREMYASGKAQVNAQYEDNLTILMHAVVVENEEFLEKSIPMLVEVGADLEIKDYKGRTALHYAAHRGNKKAVEVLLANGADPSQETGEGFTALDLARAKDHDDVAALLGAVDLAE